MRSPFTAATLLARTALLLLIAATTAAGSVEIRAPQVEYRTTPLGIDVARPRFSWHLEATAGERGVSQQAYQIVVTAPDGRVAWDTGRVAARTSLGLAYGGTPLAAATRYAWQVTVWLQDGSARTTSSWFETGLMDPAPDGPAWAGAQWIGGRERDMVLYAPYLPIFDLSYTVTIAEGSTRAGFVFGANDSRLMDRHKNIHQLESPRDGSYIRLDLDVSEVGRTPSGTAKLHVYRVGYAPADSAATPFHTFEIPATVISPANAHQPHIVALRNTFGLLTLGVDGETSLTPVPKPGAAPAAAPSFGPRNPPNAINVNPMGQGGDFLTFGLLCDIGVAVPAGQVARFRDITVRNVRAPNNALFTEHLVGEAPRPLLEGGAGVTVRDGEYVVTGGARGTFVVRDPSRNAAPMLRTTFEAGKPIASARLYVTARGIYEVFLNGQRVGTDHYNPGLTQYNATHLYQTYDVTSLVRQGRNAVGAWLGEGWWSGLLSFGTVWNHFGDRQSLRAKLVVTYRDGSSDTIVTNDRSWRFFGDGPLRYSSLSMGEVHDASRDALVEGWTTPRYDDRRWAPAVEVPLQGSAFIGEDVGFLNMKVTPIRYDRQALVGQVGETAGVFSVVRARTVSEVRPGVFVYDLGQNIVGVPRLTLRNVPAGQRVTLRFAEMRYPDLPESRGNVGMIMTENYRAALSQDIYTTRAGDQVWQPRFTSHGFQYVEVTGLDRALPVEAVEGVVISSVRELSADYRTSSAAVNRLWSNITWSTVDNFLSIPTDCPQRNERMGWSGDLNVFSRTATYVAPVDQFLTRHMTAMRDVQAPNGRFTDIAPVGGGFGGVLWGSAGVVVPWEAYQQYGDQALLAQHYPAMKAYVDYLETTIDPKTGLSNDATLGDWLGPQNDLLGAPFLATAYHAYALDILSRAAEVLAKPQDAATYRAAHEKRKAFFNATFVDAEGRTIATGRGGFGPPPPGDARGFRLADSQSSYAVPLAMGLFDATRRTAMGQRLADTVTRANVDDGKATRPPYSLMTGFIGTAWISAALSETGRTDLAYRLLLNDQYPSWLYPVKQGATTIWERLNGYTVENGFGGNNGMNSFNHYSFGAVGQWLLAHSLGIQRETPGFATFVLAPEPDPTGGLTSAEGHYDSVHGRITSAWRLDGTTLTYTATVPPNTTATLRLPTTDVASVREGNAPATKAAGVTVLPSEGGDAAYRLASGSYRFTATWSPVAR